MKPITFALSALALTLAAGPVSTPSLAQGAARTMTPQDLVTLKQIAAPTASPDGKWVVWQQTDTDPASYNIQYSLFPNNASVPIPPDSGFAEFDGSTKPSLVATTKLTLDQAREFYDKELTSQGWLIRELGRSSKDDNSWLSYISGQSDLTIRLTKLPDGRTLVRAGDSKGSLWEGSQKKEEPADAKAVVGLEAADFPVLKVPHSVKFDAIAKTIEVTVEKSTLAAATEQFTKALGLLDWKPEAGGIRDEEYTLLRFRKGKKEITLRARSKDGHAMLSFEGDGLVWNKELPTGKKIVSYETWLRLNKQPAGLELLDRYETEMRAIKMQMRKEAFKGIKSQDQLLVMETLLRVRNNLSGLSEIMDE